MSTEPDRNAPANQVPSDGDAPRERFPILFALTIAMAALYVGYRLVQMTVAFVNWLF